MNRHLSPEVMRAIVAEFERIGLAMAELPGLAIDAGAELVLLERLKRIPAGSSWADVFPDFALPATPPDSDTYKDSPEPIAAFDDLAPEGSAIVAFFDPHVSDEDWVAFVAELRARGFPVHSAGIILRQPDFLEAGLVLRVGVTRERALETFDLVVEALHQHPGIGSLLILRYGFDYHGARRATATVKLK